MKKYSKEETEALNSYGGFSEKFTEILNREGAEVSEYLSIYNKIKELLVIDVEALEDSVDCSRKRVDFLYCDVSKEIVLVECKLRVGNAENCNIRDLTQKYQESVTTLDEVEHDRKVSKCYFVLFKDSQDEIAKDYLERNFYIYQDICSIESRSITTFSESIL